MPINPNIAFDLIALTLLLVAFFAGYQKGVLRIFTVVLAIFSALLVLAWLLPYLTDFFYASFPYEQHNGYHLMILIVFVALTALCFLLIRVLWKKDSSDKSLLLQKALGGVTMVLLMVITIGTINAFLHKSHIINAERLNESIAIAYLKPVQKWSIKLLDGINRNAEEVRKQKIEARQDQM